MVLFRMGRASSTEIFDMPSKNHEFDRLQSGQLETHDRARPPNERCLPRMVCLRRATHLAQTCHRRPLLEISMQSLLGLRSVNSMRRYRLGIQTVDSFASWALFGCQSQHAPCQRNVDDNGYCCNETHPQDCCIPRQLLYRGLC